MKNKYFSLLLILVLVFSVGFLSSGSEAAQKIIKKTVKKVITPSISPVSPPSTSSTLEAPTEIPAAPIAPLAYQPGANKGLFGWDLNTDLSGMFLLGRQGLMGAIGGTFNLVFADPMKLGSAIGLAEDAVEYKVGLGGAIGNDNNNLAFKTIQLSTDMVVYLKEGSLFGMDPYIGTALTYNLYGTGQVTGGLGWTLFGGILADLGFESGKTAFGVGLGSLVIQGTRQSDGLSFFVSQPLKL
ncbi:MAG: hypothetical protein KKB81_02565 [Candidatus Margulisbacteria bacterium]|nr:hypothetical protein [Candidatus Margulisiibacteriota bacterium]MBU1022136.1 hypothetical protein [Candidatus Margulisiibacteriota bacterium]MBU1729425.1 hypothetical protein [Candidatus Margulisiibacteriota bacterium]MBU1955698.1 hypothetical protein [Candidatus Margulisiibacteriota bacterium]